MKKKLHELTREEYETLYRSGMMGEFYPEASGCFERDVEERAIKVKKVLQDSEALEEYFEYSDTVNFPVMEDLDFSLKNISTWLNKPVKRLSIEKHEFEQIKKELEEHDEERINVIGQNGNDGLVYTSEESYTVYKEIMEEIEKAKTKNVNELDGFNLGTYQRAVKDVVIDIYDILELYKVYNPATAHAIKKLLMPGQRGNKGVIQDLEEAKQSITRAIELEKSYHEGV